jgi:hypothetical protein
MQVCKPGSVFSNTLKNSYHLSMRSTRSDSLLAQTLVPAPKIGTYLILQPARFALHLKLLSRPVSSYLTFSLSPTQAEAKEGYLFSVALSGSRFCSRNPLLSKGAVLFVARTFLTIPIAIGMMR